MFRIFLSMGVLICCAATAPGAENARPNILLIVSEDHSPQLGCYGDATARTPRLDQLAAEGVRFERAYVPFSVCSPSRAVFLTGLYPHQNGQIGLATHKFAMYDAKTPTAFSLLKAAGYRTVLIGKLHILPEEPFPCDMRAIPEANYNRRDVADYAATAAKVFRSDDRPFFLSINFPDAHLPFLPQQFGLPEPLQTASDVQVLPWVGVESERLKQVTADYYNCLARLDTGVGLVLDELEKSGKSDNTLVIFLSDHGAQFPRGKYTVYEGGLRIPLIVRWPGVAQPGEVRNELVSTVDLLPTFLAAARIPLRDDLPGRALQPLLQPGRPEWREYVYGFCTGAYPGGLNLQWSIRDDRYKLILNLLPGRRNLSAEGYFRDDKDRLVSGLTPDEQETASPEVAAAFDRFKSPPLVQLFDLQSDPDEWYSLADRPEHQHVQERLLSALERFRSSTADPFLDERNVKEFVQSMETAVGQQYLKQSAFVWPYLSSFPAWRSGHLRAK